MLGFAEWPYSVMWTEQPKSLCGDKAGRSVFAAFHSASRGSGEQGPGTLGVPVAYNAGSLSQLGTVLPSSLWDPFSVG